MSGTRQYPALIVVAPQLRESFQEASVARESMICFLTGCRYVNKSDWNVTHQSAQIYKDFFKQVDDEHLLASSDVQFYTESDIGFC